MLNNNLRIDELQTEYETNNRITIKNILHTDIADKLLASLENDLPWQLAYIENGRPSIFSAEQLANLDREQLKNIYEKIARLGEKGFQFCYYHYSISSLNMSTCQHDAFIYDFQNFLKTETFFSFVKKITGVNEIKNIEVLAARYTANNFLMMHNDSDKPERRVAFVFNLTKNWHVDFGGLLNFIGQDGLVKETFVPTHNCLTLFKVPALHNVSYIMPYVTKSRYTVTGWLTI